ncbi:hypothetical protein [Spirosoma migulaei]
MSEQTDKPLHDWVRQSLDTYRPDYNPTDWARLQRTLRRRRWVQWGALTSVCLLLVGLISWFVVEQQTDNVKHSSTTLLLRSPKPALILDSIEAHNSDALTSSSGIPKMEKLMPTAARSSPLYSFATVKPTSVLQPVIDILSPTRKLNLLPTDINEHIPLPHLIAFSPEETAIKQQMITGDFGIDSTSYRVLDRNLRTWPDAVVVCDFTTSMYPYTTQLFAWFRKNARNPAIKGMVFFTDCDSLGQQTRPGGPAGRMFVTRERDPAKALPILLDAARNTTRNNDDAENDIEALLFAQQTFPEAKHLILLADNISTVKDIALLSKVKKPVHVVLCGTTGSDTTRAFQPDYYRIASHTKGSVHTLEDDLTPSLLSRTTTLRVGSHYYRYVAHKKQFKLTPFSHRPRHFLKLIWL